MVQATTTYGNNIMRETDKTLAQIVKEARGRLNLSQDKLAATIGIKQSHISRIENGDGGLKKEKLPLLSKAIGVPLDQLLGLELVGIESPIEIAKNEKTPTGLAELAKDKRLAKQFEINKDEWRFLSLLHIPKKMEKSGYLAMLLMMRALTGD